MSKQSLLELWRKRYGDADEVQDYAGRIMKISARHDPNSSFQPTLDHIKPTSIGGKDTEGNIEICNRVTNAEKGDIFPVWKANKKLFCAKKVKGAPKGTAYTIEEV